MAAEVLVGRAGVRRTRTAAGARTGTGACRRVELSWIPAATRGVAMTGLSYGSGLETPGSLLVPSTMVTRAAMFEEFSTSYYLGRLYVTPSTEGRALIERTTHERVKEQLYAASADVSTPDSLVMKLDTAHFPVHGDDGVPTETLAVPEQLLDDLDVTNPPTLTEVFLAKADRAEQLLQFARPPEPDDDDTSGPPRGPRGPRGPGGPGGPAGM